MKNLRIFLGAQLLFFGAWAGFLLTSRSSASPEFLLETVPVDPRDLLSGTYVALSYPAANPGAPACRALLRDALSMYVKLEDSGVKAQAGAGELPIYMATDCSGEKRSGWAKAKIEPAWGGTRAQFGIEKFFLNENDPRKDARSGDVLARVKIDDSGQLVLLDLVLKNPPAQPQ